MILDWIKNRPIAHRGLHSNNDVIPENSLSAFQVAVDKNYPIELDIHLLSDDEIVVFHDGDLKRMCGENIFIKTLNSNNIKNYKLLNSKQTIPLLNEVFDLVKGQVPILIEIKNQGKRRNKKIQNILIKQIEKYKGEIAIQSFNPYLLKLFVKNAPSIPRGQLSSSYKGEKINFLQKVFLKKYYLNFISQPHFIGHNIQDIPNKSVEKLRKNGLPILAWTVRDKETHKKKESYIDNIIFEGFEP